jgi:YidC/Oxa1 family membrane protein insertase
MYNNRQDEVKDQDKAKTEKAAQNKAKAETTKEIPQTIADTSVADSVKIKKLQSSLGSFAYSATLPSAKENFTTLENEVLKLKIANKGGYIAEAILKDYKKFDKNSNQLVALIKDNNANFNLQLQTKDNRVLNAKDLFFEPTLTTVDGNQVLSMKLKTSENAFLEYKYVLKPKNYMLDFDIRSQGLNTALNSSKTADLQWDLKTYSNEKSISYENRYAEIYFEHEEGKVDYAGLALFQLNSFVSNPN